ncbi:hypothetical protein HPB50_007555 [Hyalomma asiaticum]|uniref:Uncharacterized protein n=1 Tax=Hyalomma asiaticum TaxID=266040 RepID=A0ACB7TE50_HYAAI|nr:hypothetical protein HPB50_007555 [Hyalomma asiaticum]
MSRVVKLESELGTEVGWHSSTSKGKLEIGIESARRLLISCNRHPSMKFTACDSTPRMYSLPDGRSKDIKEDKTASTTLSVDKYVSEEYRDYSRAFKDLNAAIEKINREVINALGLGESEIPCVRGASSATSCERDLRVPTVQPYVPWPNPNPAMRPPDYDDVFS